MYFQRRSALKFTFLLKNNNHESTSLNDTRCWIFVCVGTALPRRGGNQKGGLCFCVRERGAAQLCGHTLLIRSPQPACSTAPVSPAPIFQSPEENRVLYNPPPCPTPPTSTPFLRKRSMKWMSRRKSSVAEEEADPRKINGGGTIPPDIIGTCIKGWS